MSREIIAILRGLRPEEAEDIGAALVEIGIDRIEVPLNSPSPLRSIERLAARLGDHAAVGAGTVLRPEEVDAVWGAGGTLIVSPDCNPTVIERTKARGMHSYPGVATATECFTALRHGADGLKIFPAFLVAPRGLAALSAVLPAGTRTYAVGGVGPENFRDWFAAGATGFGIGTGVYRPGFTASDVSRKAREIVAAYDSAIA